MMDLIIDNQPGQVTENAACRVTEVIERVSLDLQQKNRVISEIFVNDQPMGGVGDPNIANLTVGNCSNLKLISEEPRKLAHKVLYDIAGYMPRIQAALVETSVRIQSRREEEGLSLLENVSSTWAELYMGLQNAIIITGLDTTQIMVGDKSFAQINTDLQQHLVQVSDLVEEHRFLELSDILEYELAPKIPLVEEGIYRLVRELERKLH